MWLPGFGRKFGARIVMTNGNSAVTPKNLPEALERAQGLEGSLAEKLAAYTAWHRVLSPVVAAAYDRLIVRATAAGVSPATPDVGEPMIDFVLPDREGHLVSLNGLLEEGPLVVSFNRGHWCPFCRTELREIAAAHGELQALGAQVVSIIPERAEYCNKLVEDNGLPVQVLSDIDLGLALELGLVIWTGDQLGDLFLERNLNIPLFQGNDGWFLPTPASFVVGRDGTVLARSVEPDFRRRMEIGVILGALKNAVT